MCVCAKPTQHAYAFIHLVLVYGYKRIERERMKRAREKKTEQTCEEHTTLTNDLLNYSQQRSTTIIDET